MPWGAPDSLSAQLPHAHTATLFPGAWSHCGTAIPISEAAEMDKFGSCTAEVQAAIQPKMLSSWGFLTGCNTHPSTAARGGLWVLSNAQTPSDLVWCPVHSALPDPKTWTKAWDVSPASLCHRLLCLSSCCWAAIASGNQHLMCHQYSEATPVSRSKVQGLDWQCLWLYLALIERAGWSGTAAEEGRRQTRGGRSSPGARQHSSLFHLEGFSEPCSMWPFTWAEKSDSRCW